jgi:hypothetical protein
MDTRAYHRWVALLAAVWALIATVAAIFAEPLWMSAGLSRFWFIVAVSATWTVPVVLWTFVAVGDVSLSVNSGLAFPMIVLFAAASPYVIAAALAAAVNIVYVLASRRTADARGDRRSLAFAAALGLEAGAVFRLFGESLWSATAVVVAVAALLWMLRLPSARTSWRNSLAAVAMAVLLASWFAFVGKLSAAAAAAVPAAAAPAGNPASNAAGGPDVEAMGGGGQFDGVILWPEEQKVTSIVAPLPAWVRASEGALADRMSIPFSGEYWMFTPPFKRPPANSILRRGKPTRLGFHAVNDKPMLMEAHQSLPMAVDLRCCRAVAMEVENLDSHPGVIVLEMVLVDGERRLSLGERIVTGRSLRWEIPRDAVLRRFDESAIVFHREPMPLGFSAKLAIERFVLLPR